MTTFNGFPADALEFFEEITVHNNRDWFAANKERFKRSVQQPAQQLVDALGERLQTLLPDIQYDSKLNGGSIMRIHRNVRFSKDKSPYKTNLGIMWWEGSGRKIEEPGFYFHLDREGAWTAGGLYMFPKAFMADYRQAVDAPKSGEELDDLLAEIDGSELRLGGESYVRVPRGFDAEHPRVALLKRKGLVAISPPIAHDTLTSAELVECCFNRCQQILPLHHWLVRVASG